jgi:hypothetical protein
MLHCIKSLDQTKLNKKFKVIISPLSETKSESKSFTILFYGNLLNSACELYSNSHNRCVVTKNVHMTRCWKAELVAYGICIQTSQRFMYLLPLKLDHSSVCPDCPESLQHPVLTSKVCSDQTMCQNRPYK